MLSVTTVTADEELEQILQLQKKYLLGNIDGEEMKSQGFLTVQHTREMLNKMHRLAPSIIIKDETAVVGYALTMLRECRHLIAPLEPMFATFDHMQWRGKPLNEYDFYVMGQICVAKEYRGQGLFDGLYHGHRDTFQSQYDFIITEVATRNTRSLRAHERVGFQTIQLYRDSLDEWAVVLWDWK